MSQRQTCLEFLRKMVPNPGDSWASEMNTLALILWGEGYCRDDFRAALVAATNLRASFRVTFITEDEGRRTIYQFANIGTTRYVEKEFISESHHPSRADTAEQ